MSTKNKLQSNKCANNLDVRDVRRKSRLDPQLYRHVLVSNHRKQVIHYNMSSAASGSDDSITRPLTQGQRQILIGIIADMRSIQTYVFPQDRTNELVARIEYLLGTPMGAVAPTRVFDIATPDGAAAVREVLIHEDFDWLLATDNGSREVVDGYLSATFNVGAEAGVGSDSDHHSTVESVSPALTEQSDSSLHTPPPLSTPLHDNTSRSDGSDGTYGTDRSSDAYN